MDVSNVTPQTMKRRPFPHLFFSTENVSVSSRLTDLIVVYVCPLFPMILSIIVVAFGHLNAVPVACFILCDVFLLFTSRWLSVHCTGLHQPHALTVCPHTESLCTPSCHCPLLSQGIIREALKLALSSWPSAFFPV